MNVHHMPHTATPEPNLSPDVSYKCISGTVDSQIKSGCKPTVYGKMHKLLAADTAQQARDICACAHEAKKFVLKL